MRYKHILAFSFVALLNFICFSQNTLYTNANVKKIKESTKFENDEITIIAKIKDSTKNIHIYLINRTSDTLNIFGGYSAQISFNKEIKDVDGTWKPFDLLPKGGYKCLTGIKTIKLPKDTYTYEIYNSAKYAGEFNTEIRFLFKTKDASIIYSKPVEVSVNYDLLLKPLDRLKKYFYNQLEQNDTLSNAQKEQIISRIIAIHSKEGNHKKSIILCKDFLENSPNSIRLKYTLGKVLVKYTAKHRNELTKVQINTLLSWAINELKSIRDSDNPIYVKSIKDINHYSKLLLSKSEWKELKKEECITKNESCFCYYSELSNEKIRILYRN